MNLKVYIIASQTIISHLDYRYCTICLVNFHQRKLLKYEITYQ